jgi:hypothetical protein
MFINYYCLSHKYIKVEQENVFTVADVRRMWSKSAKRGNYTRFLQKVYEVDFCDIGATYRQIKGGRGGGKALRECAILFQGARSRLAWHVFVYSAAEFSTIFVLNSATEYSTNIVLNVAEFSTIFVRGYFVLFYSFQKTVYANDH